MNASDKLELLRLAKENVRLQRLMEKHEALKERIRLLRKRGMLTTKDEQEVNKLKVKKLRSKDEMTRIVRSLRTVGPPTQASENLQQAAV